MHQVATLSVQLGLGSALVDWYRDATSVPFGNLLVDLSPRTDDRLRYCTTSGNIPSKFYEPDNFKHLKYLDDEHTKFLYSPRLPALFPRMRNSVSKNLSEKIYPISQRVHRQPVARKLVRSKNKTRRKVQRQNSRTVFKKNNLEATKMSPFVAKRMIIVHKNNNSSNSLTIVTKQELPKYKPEQISTYHKDTLKKEINQQLSTSASPLLNKTLQSPRIKLSDFNTSILDVMETGVLLKDFTRRLKRKNVPIPVIYFTLLDAASITPNLVVSSHAKGKERGAWNPFKI